MRRGLLRPEREILISPKLWRLIVSEKLKGYEVEVAQLEPLSMKAGDDKGANQPSNS